MGDESLDMLRADVDDIYTKLDHIRDDVYDIRRENAEAKVEIRVLCRDVQSLTNAIKWGCCTVITCFGGFFIWAIQQKLF